MQTDSTPQIQSLRVFFAFSEKLAKMVSEITWIIYNYNQFSLHWKSSHCISLWVCQCPESGDLRPGMNFRHHNPLSIHCKSQPHQWHFRTFSNWTAPIARPFLNLTSPLPHPLPPKDPSLWIYFSLLAPSGMRSISFPIAIPFIYLNKMILCPLSILHST